MQDFRIIEKHTISWKELIPKIEPNMCALQLRDDDNFIIGWGRKDEFLATDKFDFKNFLGFRESNKDNYSFGYLSYDIKNDIEVFLKSNNEDELKLPLAYWFVPEHIILRTGNTVSYSGSWSKSELDDWLDKENNPEEEKASSINLQPIINKSEYVQHLTNIKEHIQRGDIYETNYCINFNSTVQKFNPFQNFKKLVELSTAPFSAYFNFEHGAILSASPERFLKKENSVLTSQPIKGTAPRNKDKKIDFEHKKVLQHDPKERSENIMIVDLVRNDLSKLAKKNSVSVDELCEVYSFQTVHQLISTIKCELKSNINIEDIIKASFPMGSMTGAPKISAMQIAEQEEDFKRGIYSGAFGFFQPNGNFDLNVVIRSIYYSKTNHIIGAAVGGAITIKSDPEKEFQECLTKLEAIKKALC